MLHKIIKNAFWNLIYCFSYFVPKSSKIWVFGAWRGRSYSDNPKYLYRYTTTHHTQIKAVWLTRNNDIVSQLRAKKQTVYLADSIRGIWYSCRAKVGIITHEMSDLNRFAVARMKIVQTWHGIPMKQVLLADQKRETIKKRNDNQKRSVLMPYLKKEFNHSDNLVICSSSNYVTQHILVKCFGRNSPLEVVGFPRLDALFESCHISKLTKQIELFKKEGKNVGIYMPTFRRQEDKFDIVKYFIDNIPDIEQFLIKKNTILYVKLHPREYLKFKSTIDSYSIYFICDSDIKNDIYSILNIFDYLVSDYSSIIFDYLVLVRPTYLLVPDRDKYVKSNGDFVYDYTSIGIPVATSWSDWLSHMDKPYETLCAKPLHSISNKYHKYHDCHNSKRLCEHILSNI